MDRSKPEGGCLLQKGNTRTWPLWDTSDRGGCRRCSFTSLLLALPSVTCPHWTCSLLGPLILLPIKHSTRLPLKVTLIRSHAPQSDGFLFLVLLLALRGVRKPQGTTHRVHWSLEPLCVRKPPGQANTVRGRRAWWLRA